MRLRTTNTSVGTHDVFFFSFESAGSLAGEEFTAYIGLDWASAKHDVCVQASNSDRRESGKFQHTAAHIDQWAHDVHTRFGGRIAVALELTKGPIDAYAQMRLAPNLPGAGLPADRGS